MSEGIEIEQLARRLVIGHKRDGRSVYDEQTKRELVLTCLRGRLSVAKVARECRMNANVLSAWIRQHERAAGTQVMPGSGEVVDITSAEMPAFVPVKIDDTPSVPAACAISIKARLPNGVVLDLDGCDFQQASQLIDALGRMRCSASTKG